MTSTRYQQTVCLRCHKVVFISKVRSEGIVAIVSHLEDDHGHHSSMIIEGGDFSMEPAVTRCDLCGVPVEAPVWTYYTRPGFAEDNGWCVCSACHELIVADQLQRLLHRVVDEQCTNFAVDKSQVIHLTMPKIRGFLDNRVGEPVREDVL